MKKSKMPDAYIGREQAYVKHTILKTYLQRLFMIVGQSKELTINYVDCFAGPWSEQDADNFSDTSIGISLEQMVQCQKQLKNNISREVTFRALYIEKDPEAYKKLEFFLTQDLYPSIDAQCFHGDYTELVDDIKDWCNGCFTFFFVDPTGWKKVVGAPTMQPLLELENSEFLINLMYDFVNRAVPIEKHAEDIIELFGVVPDLAGKSPEQRQEIVLKKYRENLNDYYCGRTAYVPVEKPGKDRVHYYLVYLTRHPVGINVFKTEAEGMEMVQRVMQKEYKLRKRTERSGMDDLFGDDVDQSVPDEGLLDNRSMAKEFIINSLSKDPLLIDNNKWADFLEESDLYPGDFQMAMKKLVLEGLVKNLDADVSKRRSKIVKPDWPNKSERWVLV